VKRLYVLYDGACGVCCRAVARLAWEPAYIELRFAPAGSAAVQEKFGEALAGETRQVVVVADTGEVYRGASAWIMVLYALRRWRPLAMRLATPMWRPWVERAIDFIGRHRYQMSLLCGGGAHVAVLRGVRADARSGTAVACGNGACEMGANGRRGSEATEVLLAARAAGRWESWMDEGTTGSTELNGCSDEPPV
jgi:predicted DCC family thiol-disulfide oxidoreductase YuxK